MLLKWFDNPWCLALSACLLALCGVKLMIRVAFWADIVDRPAHRKIHKQPVPYLGGVAVVLALLFVSLGWSFTHRVLVLCDKSALILTASVAAMVLGLLDDKYQLRARSKFLGQFLIASTFAFIGYRFDVIMVPGMQPFHLHQLSMPITVFWIMAIINAMNMIDGIDGLCGSVALVILAVIATMSYYLNDVANQRLALIGLGALLGFLYFNWRPARIYLGDAGTHGLGMLIAGLLVSLGQHESFSFRMEGGQAVDAEPFLYQVPLVTAVVAYPLLEISFTVIRRLIKGKPIGSADRDHIHHRLMNIGWNAPFICYAAVGVSVLAGGVAVSNAAMNKGLAAWLLVLGGVVIGLGTHQIGLLEMFHLATMRQKRAHFLIANHFISMQKLKLKLANNLDDSLRLINQTCTELGVHAYNITILADETGNPFQTTWERPVNAQSTLVYSHAPSSSGRAKAFSDQLNLTEINAMGAWTFEPIEKEEDIDIEHRVLMSDFMRRAIAQIEELNHKNQQSRPEKDLPNSGEITASSIRRRDSLLWSRL